MSRVRKTYSVAVDPKWCKACGICIAFCPRKVFDTGGDGKAVTARPEDCIGCRLCELRCPDFAVLVTEDEEVNALNE